VITRRQVRDVLRSAEGHAALLKKYAEAEPRDKRALRRIAYSYGVDLEARPSSASR
jgi:hypothetical protein